MQVRLFIIPAEGGDVMTEEMNAFLRSKKVLQVDTQFASNPGGAYWCFCIRYADDLLAAEREKPKIDYRTVLDEATFKRFSELRAIRKKIATTENIPAYTIFHDEELAELAKQTVITAASMKAVKGIGDKKVEKYGLHFFSKTNDEKSGQAD